jgi:hypothetical protein
VFDQIKKKQQPVQVPGHIEVKTSKPVAAVFEQIDDAIAKSEAAETAAANAEREEAEREAAIAAYRAKNPKKVKHSGICGC